VLRYIIRIYIRILYSKHTCTHTHTRTHTHTHTHTHTYIHIHDASVWCLRVNVRGTVSLHVMGARHIHINVNKVDIARMPRLRNRHDERNGHERASEIVFMCVHYANVRYVSWREFHARRFDRSFAFWKSL